MPEALKDIFFRPAFFDDLASAAEAVYPAFDRDAFLQGIFTPEWDARALKDRVRHTTLTLRPLLPDDYREALAIMRAILPRVARYGFEQMVWPDFVELYGLDDWESSLPAFEEFTQAMSAEFAVRPFIKRDQKRMMAQMLRWAAHSNEAVRRLASEGCRPRLPWAMALPALKRDPSPILPILELLKNDPSETVRRSVANNLNDISKDNPDVVIALLRAWQSDATPEVEKLTSHALRTLLKAGNPGALTLLGYPPHAKVAVHNLNLTPEQIALGESITFEFDVVSESDAPQNLMIDYMVHLTRKNAKTSEKVFKLTKRMIAPGETIRISKQQSFESVSTRQYYPGPHAIEVQVNGTRLARIDFEITG